MAILTDLSKAFDCLNHELLIAKWQAYGFGILSFKYIYSYLHNKWHISKQGLTLVTSVLQGSMLGTLIFNISTNNSFLFNDSFDIASYGDENTL